MIETWQQDLPHGITLSCRACGERGRPLLMFLHGFPEAAFVWDILLEHFARPEHGGYRCVAPNLRGYEHSSAPPDVKDYRAKHLVQDIVALMDAECGAGQAAAALVAHDWGGGIAWNLANQHSTRLRQLVIINSPHPGTFLRELQNNPAQQAASDYMNFLVRPDAAALLAENDYARLFGFFEGMGATATPGTPGAPIGAGWLTASVRDQYRNVWRHGLNGGLNYYRASPLRPATAQDPLAQAVSLPPEMLHIPQPTLVLWAQGDIALLPGLCEGLDAFVPQLQLVPLPQATHWVVHEQPTRVITEIAAFLKAQ
jgi:pimeloyl-ACP methyl ester carboxylesterase